MVIIIILVNILFLFFQPAVAIVSVFVMTATRMAYDAF